MNQLAPGPHPQNAEPVLNQGQQAAADAFFQFLFSDQKEFGISGPGGVGKTFTMGYLIDEILPRYFETCSLMGIEPRYDEVIMTATTNKAADVLSQATARPTLTIHSFLNLKVRDDYKTGRQILTKTRQWKVHERKILFVDECSMIDSDLYFMIHQGTLDCKIVYVGDHCQLAPVMEVISPVYRNGIQTVELTEPMRNAEQPALMALCQQLRNTVETGNFQPIQIVPGVIDYANDDQMQLEIEQHFKEQNNSARILAYTNQRVIDFNDHIRGLRGLPSHYCQGEILVNNSAIQLSGSMLSVEKEVTIDRISSDSQFAKITNDVQLEYREADLSGGYATIYHKVRLPVDMTHFRELLRWAGRSKMFDVYFDLKNNYADLRPRDSSTVYKAQGSTYDTTFIDVGNISTCNNPNQVARMLYVAATRSRKRIVLYGNLAEKYGGLVH